MWLYLIGVVLLIVGIVGGVLTGGIFTIVLLPLAALALISAFVFALLGRSAQGRSDSSTEAPHTSDRPLPHRQPADTGPEVSTPDQLADARRQQQ